MSWQTVVLILGIIWGIVLLFCIVAVTNRRRENAEETEPDFELEDRLDRIELAIGTMAQWLVQAQTGFGAQDAQGIEKILRGETPHASS